MMPDATTSEISAASSNTAWADNAAGRDTTSSNDFSARSPRCYANDDRSMIIVSETFTHSSHISAAGYGKSPTTRTFMATPPPTSLPRNLPVAVLGTVLTCRRVPLQLLPPHPLRVHLRMREATALSFP